MTKTGPLITGLALTAALLFTACTDSAAPSAGSPAMEATPTTGSELPVSSEMNTMDAQNTGDQGSSTVQLNPAHGEPGHRCEIPVGAPLDGVPSSEGTTITIPPTEGTPSPVAAPITMPTNTNSGKLNPAHGEPGHDCAVPVGSPLPG
ncbi:MAG: hypothetical protein KDC01_10090 [Flavobacteriales bacterium]|jgi:hypothetical protein|nr:hypothetical protein [Flavobacteriales bacterium]